MFTRITSPVSVRLATIGLIAAGTMLGCESESKRTRHAEPPPERAARVQPTTTADERWFTQTMAYPTGDRADSVLLLEKRGPRAVRVGQPIEYQLTVTNISNQPLENVVIQDWLPENFLAHGEGREIMPGQPGQVGQDVYLYFAEPNGGLEPGMQQQPQQRMQPQMQEPQPRMQQHEQPMQPRTQEPQPRTRVETTREWTDAGTPSNPRTGPYETANIPPELQQQHGSLQVPIDREPTVREAPRRVEPRPQPRMAAPTGPRLELGQEGSQYPIGYLAPGESRTITIRGYADAPGVLQSCATVSYQPTVCFATEVTQPLVRIERQVPQTVNACEPFQIRYRLINTGTGPVNNIVIREQLPEGLSLQRDETAARMGQQVELRADTLAQNQTREFTVTAVANRGGQFTTQAIATDEAGNQIQSMPSQITVRAAALKLAVEAPQQAFSGRNVPIRLTVTNTGDAPARDLVIRQQVPSGTRLTGGDRARQEGNNIVWTMASLQPGQSATVNSTVSLAGEGQIALRAEAEALCTETATATAQTNVTGLAAILLEVVDTEDPVAVGQQERYVVRVTNQGTVADTNIRVQVTLPQELRFVSSSPGAAAPAAAGQPQAQAEGNTITFTIPSLAAGQSRDLQINAEALQPGDVRLQVQMTSDQLTTPVTETEATRLYQ